MSANIDNFSEFAGRTVRVEAGRVCIIDVLSLLLVSRDASVRAWAALRKSTDPAVVLAVGAVTTIKIGGRGREISVATEATMVELIYFVPGKRACMMRPTITKYIGFLLSQDACPCPSTPPPPGPPKQTKTKTKPKSTQKDVDLLVARVKDLEDRLAELGI